VLVDLVTCRSPRESVLDTRVFRALFDEFDQMTSDGRRQSNETS
jgi:hypothetical protein